MRRIRWRTLAATLAAAAIGACRDGRRQAPVTQTTSWDSAGVTIVENSVLAQVPHWRLAATPMRVIGGNDTATSQQLFGASSAMLTTDGHLVIGNSGANEVLVLSGDGRSSLTFGRRGRGPGEFGGTIRVWPSEADEILVEDIGWQGKLLRFSVTGALTEEVLLPPRISYRGGAWSDAAVSPAGVQFMLGEPLGIPDPGPSRPLRGPASVVRFSYYGEVLDTIATYLGIELLRADVGPQPAFGGGMVSGPRTIAPLFGPTTRLAGGGSPWHVVVADQAQASFQVFLEDGTRIRDVRWQPDQRRPTSADIVRAGEAYVQSHRQDKPGAIRALEVMPPVSVSPVFDHIVVGRDNRIWIRAYVLPTDPAARWWIFEDGGRLVAEIEMPVDARVLEAGADYVIAHLTDAFDVERIKLWSIDLI